MERYGRCTACNGTGTYQCVDRAGKVHKNGDCFICNGNGFSGDAMEQYQRECDLEWDRDRTYERSGPWEF